MKKPTFIILLLVLIPFASAYSIDTTIDVEPDGTAEVSQVITGITEEKITIPAYSPGLLSISAKYNESNIIIPTKDKNSVELSYSTKALVKKELDWFFSYNPSKNERVKVIMPVSIRIDSKTPGYVASKERFGQVFEWADADNIEIEYRSGQSYYLWYSLIAVLIIINGILGFFVYKGKKTSKEKDKEIKNIRKEISSKEDEIKKMESEMSEKSKKEKQRHLEEIDKKEKELERLNDENKQLELDRPEQQIKDFVRKYKHVISKNRYEKFIFKTILEHEFNRVSRPYLVRMLAEETKGKNEKYNKENQLDRMRDEYKETDYKYLKKKQWARINDALDRYIVNSQGGRKDSEGLLTTDDPEKRTGIEFSKRANELYGLKNKKIINKIKKKLNIEVKNE
ncbi:hypothetical protein GF336_00575 [Candidatus Woesearchaeota archaeon]|nr:hypothetical protein [Candidatus Woesearchaeota archaeon]